MAEKKFEQLPEVEVTPDDVELNKAPTVPASANSQTLEVILPQ
jgi:hypothetical protein